MEGWIKLHRQFQDNFLWKDKRVFSKAEAWIDIIMEVRHYPKPDKIMIKNSIIICNRGQSIKSIQTWANRWNWTRSAVQRFFKLLSGQGMLKTENLTKTIRLTVCNYDTYQQTRTEPESKVNRTRTEPELEADTDKNEKKDKNEKNELLSEPKSEPKFDYYDPQASKRTRETFTESEFNSTGELLGMDKEKSSYIFNHYNSQGFLKKNGLPLTDIRSMLINWRKNEGKFEPKAKPGETEHKTWGMKDKEARDINLQKAIEEAKAMGD